MDLLTQIINRKRERLEEAQCEIPLEQIRDEAFAVRERAASHALRRALQRDDINVIAEFKRRSPSKGLIRADADVAEIVRSYDAAGAAALSVLTEEDYFAGSLADLEAAKATVDLPVLRKDFVFEEYQVYESASAGADAVLLIASVLDDRQLESLRLVAEEELGMDALVEVHNSEEMNRAAGCGAKLIGINNRDLRTFQVSLETSLELAPLAPRDALLVSESGIKVAGDVQRLRERGFSGFLIGETLMRARCPEAALRELRNDTR